MKGEPWIGVDLDGTLAFYDEWRGPRHIGEAIPGVLRRVRSALAAGRKVKIFTARAADPDNIPYVKRWLEAQGLGLLEVTNEKDMDLVEIWDDKKCVQFETNKGVPVRSKS